MECIVATVPVPRVPLVVLKSAAVERGGGDSGSDTASSMLNVPPGVEGTGAPAQSLTTAAYAPPATNTTDTTITSPPTPHTTDQAQFEADKRAVYKHPLFPLLALLFERCELATQSSDTQSSDAFNLDIQAFVQHQERDRKPFLANEPEIDGLMIKAIQVLRIHLLELEKVQELCKDFCNRYITCLKGKMQSENLLRSDYTQGPGVISGLESNNNNMLHGNSESGSDSNSPIQYTISPTQQGVVHPPGVSDCMEPRTGVLATVDTSAGDPLIHHLHPTTPSVNNNTSHSPISNNSSNSNTNHSHTSSVNSTTTVVSVLPQQTPASSYHPGVYGVPGVSPTGYDPHIVHGSTPLGQIGVNVCPAPLDATGMSGQLSPAPTTPGGSGDECDSDFTGRIGSSKKQKRGVLPKHATSVMRSWLFQHLVHPYPTEDEKRHIAAQTNLTLLQVNNWFINARRRILQPMLDAGAPNSDGGGALPSHKSSVQRKKSHGGSNRRFWPQDIASLQPQLNSGVLSSSDDDECDSYSSDGDDAGGAGGLVIDSVGGVSGGSGQERAIGGANGLSNTDTRNSYSPDSDQP